MNPHQPQTVLRRLADTRWFCRCLTCDEACEPTYSKPRAEDWGRAHRKEALG